MVHRVGVWLHALRAEINADISHVAERDDPAARNLLELVSAILTEFEAAFERYKTPSGGSPAERMVWLQDLGAGLPRLLSLRGYLDGALVPRHVPLARAFSRYLDKLVPTQASVFRRVRFFNYELQEVHEQIAAEILGDKIETRRWPMLFLNLPMGLLDSPRNHALVGHELGHAIVSEHRAKVERFRRLDRIAKRSGGPAPAQVGPWFQVPAPTPAQIAALAEAHYKALSIPVPKMPAPGAQLTMDALIYGSVYGDIATRVKGTVNRWLEELFADAVGACLFGPALVFAFVDLFLPSQHLESPGTDHPPNAVRLAWLRTLLDRSELADGDGADKMSQALPPSLLARLDAVVREATDAMARFPGHVPDPVTASVYRLALDLVEPERDKILDLAVKRCEGSIYKSDALRRDLKQHLERLVKLGVPPIEPGGGASLATILNVGHVAVLDHLDEFTIGSTRPEKEKNIDELLLKAVELSVVQRQWEDA
jgi:hypothetical protein